MAAYVLVIGVISIISCMIVNAEYMQGNVNLLNDNGFSFLGHWMFGHNKGNSTPESWHLDEFKAGILDITLRLHKPLQVPTNFELALYDDQPESFPLLFSNKANACYSNSNGDQRINKTMVREYSIIHFRSDPHDGNDTWSATINIHEHIKPRWWWVYLIKCDFAKTIAGDFVKNDIHYKIHWTQYDTYKWNREISLNEEFQNTFHCVTPWLTLSLFVIQCMAYYLYWNMQSSPKGYVHIIIKLLTLLIFLQFVAACFKMAYWLHLTLSGYKEFGILTFSFLFEISANILFLYLLFTIFAVGWRMSISKLNKKLNYILIAICIVIEVFDFIIYVWSYQYYPNEETTLYRYNEKPQVVYGMFMLISGCVFYVILLFGSCRDSLNGIITKIQRNFRIIVGFCLLWTWFIWPIIAVGASETFGMSRTDFTCDVISWCMKMFSFFIVVFITHPVNPYYDRCFDFSRQFIHARYVKNTAEDPIFDDDDDEYYEDDIPSSQPASAMQMSEIKKSTVFSTKFGKNKEKKKKKSKFFKYGGRNQVGQDSDDDSEDALDANVDVNVDEYSDEDSEEQDNIAGGNNIVSAISLNAAKSEDTHLHDNEHGE